jgi:hypothetical protein
MDKGSQRHASLFDMHFSFQPTLTNQAVSYKFTNNTSLISVQTKIRKEE